MISNVKHFLWEVLSVFNGPNPPPYDGSRFSSCHPYNHFILGNISIKWIITTMQKEDLYAGK